MGFIGEELSCQIIFWLGWVMVALGVLKMPIFLIGEFSPKLWEKVKSPTFRKIVTGKGNRLIFGLGGLLTILFGLGSVGLSIVFRKLFGLG